MTWVKAGSDSASTVFTVPPEYPFVDAFAAGLYEHVDKRPEALASVQVLLPTRRACRALADAFLRQSAGRPLLLPRMTPIGDVDEDDIALMNVDDILLSSHASIPPPMPPLRRQLLLTELVQAIPGNPIQTDQAARLAAELARFLDQIYTERLDVDRLPELVPDGLAEHWQKTLTFLEIITRSWPRILAEHGCIEAADRRNRLLEAQSQYWRATPPETPVFVAGSTGSIPATADLIATVARMPTGAVVLPGLDIKADDTTWQALEPSHPQFGMARLLEHIGADRRSVEIWPTPMRPTFAARRTRIVNDALRPAAVAHLGRQDRPIDSADIAGVTRLDAAGPGDEARAIALVLREVLQVPGKTGALVTPDRALARRVAAELGRWNIAADDSAGLPLATSLPGAFLLLTANAVIEFLSPVPLLAALKHPLAGGGMSPGRFRSLVRALEKDALRGPRPAPGIDGLWRALTGKIDLAPLIDALNDAVGPMADLVELGSAPLSAVIAAHIAVAEKLAATDVQSGGERLWAGEEGEAAAAFIADLAAAAADDFAIDLDSYIPLLDALMIGHVIRPRFGRHPRLAIWGPLEARMQRADVMILGGLNEESWPPRAGANPWMSRPMMRAFGLPLPERRIGLSAHDFCQAFAAPEVWLTRSRRVEGVPTVPSRWLLRLDSILGDATKNLYAHGNRYIAWQQALDAPIDPYTPPEPPNPRPPLAARPRSLSVTQIETWMRDPYAIYARHILSLKALLPIDAIPSAAEYGSFIHSALDAFIRDYPGSLHENALDRLIEIGRRCFGAMLDRPGVYTFWWPRFERVAVWFIEHEAGRRPRLVRSWTEVSGGINVAAPGGPFTLTAKADRIDKFADGTLAIIDYKTGTPPNNTAVAAGFAPQLPLEAAIATHGGFETVPPGHEVSALTYWQLRGSNPAGEEKRVAGDPEALADDALAGISRLVAAFDDRDTAYEARPRPRYAPRYSDYEYLARVKEWAALNVDDDG